MCCGLTGLRGSVDTVNSNTLLSVRQAELLFIKHWLLTKIKDNERRLNKDLRTDIHRNGRYIILTSNCRKIYLTSDKYLLELEMCKSYSSASYQHSWSQGGGVLIMNKSHTLHSMKRGVSGKKPGTANFRQTCCLPEVFGCLPQCVTQTCKCLNTARF